MTPDPRWLEILKASGWQTAAIAAACGLFLLAARWSWLPPLDAWLIQLAAFGFLLSGCLAIASFASAAIKFFPIQVWLLHWFNTYRARREVGNYIPHMTAEERAIVGYLLAKNQKMFTCDADGGHAATLISRRIVIRALQPGQVFDMTDVPMEIPDHVWDVLLKHRDQFPYTPPKRGETEVHPWRVSWMVR